MNGIEAGETWGYCPEPRRLGELLTRGDICHVHADRADAERCGVLLGDAPELGSWSVQPRRPHPGAAGNTAARSGSVAGVVQTNVQDNAAAAPAGVNRGLFRIFAWGELAEARFTFDPS